jgi:hypothetical protein
MFSSPPIRSTSRLPAGLKWYGKRGGELAQTRQVICRRKPAVRDDAFIFPEWPASPSRLTPSGDAPIS